MGSEAKGVTRRKVGALTGGISMSNEAAGSSSHWEKSKRLLFITLAIWAFFSFVVHWFGSALNGAEGSFPGGYFMAGQGSQIAFVVLIFWFVSRQNKLDDEHGVSEE
jgi:putative solute:sodium symporter small subunit